MVAFVDTSTTPAPSDQREDSANPIITARRSSPEGDGEAMVKIGWNDVRRVKGAVPGSGFGLAEIVRKQTRRHYARPRAEVDRWVQKTFASAPASLDEVHMIVGARPRKRRALKKPPKRPDRMGS
jgi:hypothetical protein